MPRRPVSPDPLALVIQPPRDETAQQRAARAQAEADALSLSAQIDSQLEVERESLKKRAARREVKVVLLGQAESGKSTLRKQFQLQWASRTLDAERATWRPIVTLNVIRGLHSLFDQLEAAFDHASHSPLSPSSPPSVLRSNSDYSRSELSGDMSPSPTTHDRSFASYQQQQGGLDPSHAAARDRLFFLRECLRPLISMEDDLIRSISGVVHASGGIYIRSDWQASYPREPLQRASSAPPRPILGRRREGLKHLTNAEVLESVQRCLASCREYIRELWNHPYLPVLIRARRIKLQDSASFFLSAVDRISQSDYLPTDSDILHVRLQTLGVSEHIFDVNSGGKPVRWYIYDVGGTRGLRHAWAPYFDDAKAIIFLAPISAFDQYLDEDPRTNRIDDSLQIFGQICGNKLLRKAHLILMLNKTDLLREKIESGVRVKKFITSYGDRVNTYEEASQYFRAHFLQVHRKSDESKRTLFTHFTSVIDTKATKKIIYNVADSILKDHITATGLV